MREDQVRRIAAAILRIIQREELPAIVGQLEGSIQVGDGASQAAIDALTAALNAEISAREATDAALATHADLVMSTTQLGHAKIDGITITLNGDNQLVASGAGVPDPYVYLSDSDGAALIDSDGAYLYELEF